MADDVEDVCFLSVTEIADEIRTRRLSPVEVVHAFLQRIDRRNHEVNAYVTILTDDARALAREAERKVARGEPLGPLHGVPVAIKDLFDFKSGVRNTFGSRLFTDFVPPNTSVYVARLEDAGAIVLGKTNTPEFGHKGVTDNLVFGPTRNPFDLSKNAGGSSGGSAAAVADGMAAAAQGSDAGGSIRIPAAFCGVYGLKPSFGRVASVSRPDGFVSQAPLVHSGPITRTVEDAALVLQAMSGPDPGDPYSLPEGGRDYVKDVEKVSSRSGLPRLAYSPALDVFPVEPEVRRVIEQAMEGLSAAGFTVDEVVLDIRRSHAELHRVKENAMSVLCAEVASLLKSERVDMAGRDAGALTPEFADLIRRGSRLKALVYRLDNVIRTEVYDAIESVLVNYDALVLPTVGVVSIENATNGNTLGPTRVMGEPVNPLTGWALTYPFNFTGHPVASVPVGLSNTGIPVGAQVVGPRFGDHRVLEVSRAMELVRPWQSFYRDSVKGSERPDAREYRPASHGSRWTFQLPRPGQVEGARVSGGLDVDL